MIPYFHQSAQYHVLQEAEEGGGQVHPGAGGQGEDSGQAEDWRQCVKLLFQNCTLDADKI